MNWHSARELIAMGGYGPYVWGSVFVVLAAVVGELGQLAWQHRVLLAALRRDEEGGRA